MELKTKNYEIKKIKSYSDGASEIGIPKEYREEEKIVVIPILGEMNTSLKEGCTTIRVESNYIKEITTTKNKIYLPKTYENHDCLIATTE